MIAPLLISALVTTPTMAETTSAVVLRVIVNTVDRGDIFLHRTATGDILVSGEDLGRLGLRLPRPESIGSTVSLRSYAPLLRFELEESSATLRITASPEILPRHDVDLSPRSRAPTQLPGENTAFLNYQIAYRFRNDFEAEAWSLPLEAGIRFKDWLGLSAASATSRPTGLDWVRLRSSLIRDDPEHGRRIIIGDWQARSGRLGSFLDLGGVHVASEYTLRRWVDVTPQQDVQGTVETPSEVEIYVNNVLVRRERVPAGHFRFSGVPLSAGAGTLSVVTRDAFGRENAITAPFYESSAALRPVASDYSYSLGFQRRSFGARSFDYQRVALIGFHRVGLSRHFTIGTGIEADPDTYHLSPSADWIIGSLAEIQTTLAASHDRHGNGTGWLVACVRRGRHISAQLSLEGYSPNYANLSIRPGSDRLRRREFAGITFSQSGVGSLSLQFTRMDTQAREAEDRGILTYSRGLGRALSLLAGIQRNGQTSVVDGFAIMNFNLGSLRSAGIEVGRTGGRSRATVRAEQSVPTGPGVGLRVQMDATDDPREAGNRSSLASTRLQGEHGQFSYSFRDAGGARNSDMSLAGSVVLVRRSLYLARPVKDGFALVRVGRMRGVPVLLWNQKNGTTDRHGELLVPDLISYSENHISLDQRKLPIDWSLQEGDKSVTLPFRGGGVVEFETTRFQSFEGRAYFVRDGTPEAAEYATFEIHIGERTVRSFVGRRGEFYFENLPPGDYPARLALNERECRFVIHIPRSDETTVRLGDIRCEGGE